MNSDGTPWWERFFSGNNQLQWGVLRRGNDDWSAEVLPWIQFAQSSNTDLPIVLPRVDEDGTPSWYCAARCARGAMRLREALQAFIGPSYSDFEGRAYTLSLDDAVEAAYGDGTIAPAYRIRATRPSDVPKLRRAFTLYGQLLSRMPSSEERRLRPVGVLRAELDRAVVAGDEPEARRLLHCIRRIGRLESSNLLFLEVRVLAGLGHWRQITDDSKRLDTLSHLHLPRRVLLDVIESLYRVYIEPIEDPEHPEEVLRTFRAVDLDKRARLFGVRRGLTQPRILKAFFLYEVCLEREEDGRLESLREALTELKDDSFALALAGLARSPVQRPPLVSDPVVEAEEAFDSFEFEAALELYLKAPPTRKCLARLIQCSEQIGTTEVAVRVMERIESDYGSELGNLSPQITGKLESLRQLARAQLESGPSDGWLLWARWVESGVPKDDAMSLLREHLVTWDATALADDPASVEELSRIIGNAKDTAAEVFREAFPELLQAAIPESGPPDRVFKPLLQVLLTNAVLLEGPSPDELELVREIATALLGMGLGREEYNEFVSDLEDLFEYQASLSTLNWSLDITEVLVIHSCPDSEKRLRFVIRVLELGRRVSHRLSDANRAIFNQLCLDIQYECPEEFVEESQQAATGEAATVDLSGRMIAIYTLTEDAGRRAALMLSKMFPGVSVSLNSDHVCTETLKRLAKSAEFFVFAWRSSKHQAYYCVKDHRPSGWPILQPLGKGTSSILREIMDSVPLH